jgi:hypothetical protein
MRLTCESALSLGSVCTRLARGWPRRHWVGVVNPADGHFKLLHDRFVPKQHGR